MSDRDGVRIGIACDECAHEFQVGIAGVDLETFRYSCPSCGHDMGFTKDDIAQITSAHGKAQTQAIKMADDMIEKAIGSVFKKK